MGGAIIRILNPNKRTYNKLFVANIGDSDFLYEDIPSTDKPLEIKIPITDLIYDMNGEYGVYIEINNNTTNILSLDEFWLSDIPDGGDGTWHYYTTQIT